MRIIRLVSFAVVTILFATLVVVPVFSASSASQAVTPLSLTTQGGSFSGTLSNLNVLDQFNTDDTPSAYIALTTPSTLFSGIFIYQLPVDIVPSKVSSILLQVNFKGPAVNVQAWSWSILDWQTQVWIPVGDTLSTQPDTWNNLVFNIRNISSYISSGRQIKIRLQSNTTAGVAKLDYQALHVTYIQVPPTQIAATSAPGKAVFIVPTTVTPSPTNTPAPPVSKAVFAVGPGGSDVIPHQIVRTKNDYLYIFSGTQNSNLLRTYRTLKAGLPENAADFAPVIETTEASKIVSVDTLYDGGNMIHVIINTYAGNIKDYPFDTTTNTYKPAITLATDGGTAYTDIGTSGVTGMVDLNGTIHLAYWSNSNHILHRAYTYDSATNSLTPSSDFVQVDAAGNANHPVLAVSPKDNSVTVAWVSESDNPILIRARTRASNRSWGNIEIASTFQFPPGVAVWTSKDNGLNIDQGPSLIIDANGKKHMVYIESFDYSKGDYGRVHYVTNSGSGWVDTPLSFFTHDPALALSTTGNMYIIGHGHRLNSSGSTQCIGTNSAMNNMCYIKKNTNGTWGLPVLFATPPDVNTFDSSPSVKWSAIGWNRPSAVEFIFFKTPYISPTIYYGRLP